MSIWKLPDGTDLEVPDGTLIDNHPDLKPVPVEASQPQFVPIRSFHQPAMTKTDWRTAKERPASGYSNPVDDPDYLAMIQYRGIK
jgi:hypothetical protein